MRLRTDLVLLAIAVVLGGVGLFMNSQAAFADTYVRDQLMAEKITFSPADKLTAEEKNWKPASSCLTQYAGQQMATGAQAECYANYFINLHMSEATAAIGYPGQTYGSIGSVQSQLKADIAAAQKNNDTAAAAAAQKKLDAVNGVRDTLFKGDMLRSALLTVYGFSVLGSVAGTAATLCYAGAAFFVLFAAFAFMRGRAPVAVPQREPSGGVVSAR
ncbi:MAG: hypothetical protein KGN00_05090 [Chloroflexota bacterium]|nr:hypothetical protein [Chloroflexota bacterium]MDE3193043.1 hypothetical protein [Chloroflexota bacterium]